MKELEDFITKADKFLETDKLLLKAEEVYAISFPNPVE
jgi:hypothetical protein